MATLQEFITQYKDTLTGGFARTSNFELSFFNFSSGAKLFSTFCNNSTIPGYELETERSTIYSLSYEIPVGIHYDPLMVSFYVDNGFTLPAMIYNNRNDKVINLESYSPRYRDEKMLFTCVLTVFDSGNQFPIAIYTMDKCFIKTLQQQSVDWSSHNQVMNMTMMIEYEYLYEIALDRLAAVNQNNKVGNKPMTPMDRMRNSIGNFTSIVRDKQASIAGVITNLQGQLGQGIAGVQDVSSLVLGVKGQVTGVVAGVKNQAKVLPNSIDTMLNNPLKGLW